MMELGLVVFVVQLVVQEVLQVVLGVQGVIVLLVVLHQTFSLYLKVG